MASTTTDRPTIPRARRQLDHGGYLLRRAVAGRRRLPDFLVIGAHRCGTSTLFDYLCQHPSVRPPVEPDLHYFDARAERGDAWYRSHFPMDRTGGPGWTTGEACADYLLHPLAPFRASQTVPAAKLVVVLRHPVERAYSHYQEQRELDREPLSFADAVRAEPGRIASGWDSAIRDLPAPGPGLTANSYLTRGRYDEQLERWWQYFPREKTLVLHSEELFNDPQHVLDRVGAFLGLPTYHEYAYRQVITRRSGDVDPALRRALGEYFSTSVRRLQPLVGHDFGWEL
jgi:hypothetical protein